MRARGNMEGGGVALGLWLSVASGVNCLQGWGQPAAAAAVFLLPQAHCCLPVDVSGHCA